MSCPSCGARNATTATWCGQCFEPLGAAADTAADGRAGEPAGVRAAGEQPAARQQAGDPSTGAPPPPPAAHAGTGAARTALPPPPPPLPGVEPGPDAEPEVLASGAFRRTPEGLEWACRLCGEWNPLERTTCTVCGTGFGTEPTSEAPAAEVRPELLAAASVAAPGAGHVLLGRRGEGVARLLLAFVWAVGGVTLLRGALGSGRSVLPAVPLLLGWVVLAIGCTNDALVLGGVSGRVLLRPRVLLWLVVGVLGLTAVAALVGVMAVTGG